VELSKSFSIGIISLENSYLPVFLIDGRTLLQTQSLNCIASFFLELSINSYNPASDIYIVFFCCFSKNNLIE
jgi:hypothetical protein